MSLWDAVRAFLVKAGIGDWGTAGPAEDEHPIVVQDNPMGRMMQAHAGRIGPAITPKTVVVHTTDMMPDTFQGLIKRWQTEPGDGSCAHFLIGRDETQGVVQLVPINKNANHAGGKVHGNWRTPAGALIHPNTVAIGIELHGAGLLKRVGGRWIHPDSTREIPATDVYVDSRGRGWHVITPYQLRMLSKLIYALSVSGLPTDVTVAPDASYASQGVADYAGTKPGAKVVGHVDLDPINKTDPGVQVKMWLRENGYC